MLCLGIEKHLRLFFEEPRLDWTKYVHIIDILPRTRTTRRLGTMNSKLWIPELVKAHTSASTFFFSLLSMLQNRLDSIMPSSLGIRSSALLLVAIASILSRDELTCYGFSTSPTTSTSAGDRKAARTTIFSSWTTSI